MAAAIRTARAVALVALAALSVVGLQLAPVLLVDSDGVVSAGTTGEGEFVFVVDNGQYNDYLRKYSEDGSSQWSSSLSGAFAMEISPTEDAIYVADGPNLAKFDTTDGSNLWTKSASNSYSTDVVVGPRGYVFHVEDGNNELKQFDPDGTVNQTQSFGAIPNSVDISPDGSTLYVGVGSSIHAIRRDDFSTTDWTTSFDDDVNFLEAGPDGEVVYYAYGSNWGSVSAAEGSKGWESSHSKNVESMDLSPDGNVLYIGSFLNSGSGYVIGSDTTDNGSTLWTTDRPVDEVEAVGGNIDNTHIAFGDEQNMYVEHTSDQSEYWSYSRDYYNAIEYSSDYTGFAPGSPLNGTVTDADGNAVENAGVEAVNSSTGSTGATTTTNATGGYEMRVDAGEYDVTVSKSGYSPTTKTVTVPEGGTTLNFTLTSDTTITDPDPPDGATVSEPPVELSVLANTTNQSVQSIDVEFYEQNDGSSDTRIGSTTVSPGERAAVTWDPPPNTYEWYAEGTADSGATDTGGPYTLAIGEAYIIDGTEQPPDGANVDPTADVDLAVDVHVDNDATVEFYDYQTGNPDNDPLIGSQTVSSGTSTASTRWYSNERDATEEWYVVLKDSTGTRDTAGAFRFSAGGQVVARDAETGEIIDDRTVRFDTTYPGGSQTFDRSPGVLDLSEVNADQGDRIRIDVRAQHYYERTVEVPNKQSDADIYLERGPNWNSNPSSDDPENTSSVEDDPDRYLSRFEIEDRTGRYPPSNTTLAIKRDMNGDGQTDLIHRESFGAANRVGAHVKQDREYQLIIENDDGDRRRLGAWTAIGESLVQLQVSAFDFNIPEQGAGWASHASVEETENDTEVFRWQFSDPSEATSRLEVAIYERDNRSNGLLNQTYSDLGNVSYTQELTGNQTGKAWVVELDGTRNGETFTSREIVGATDLAPGIPLDPFYQEMFAVLLLLVLAGVFGGIRAETGAIIVPMTAAVLFWMGWLPGVVTASAIAAALFIAVLYRIRSTPQPGVR
jgi:hypothetical protein